MTLNCNGRLISLANPLVMGILNLTPDSFSDGGLFMQKKQAIAQVEKMLSEGADIIDIGGYSSRPQAIDISIEEEIARIYEITQEILRLFPQTLVSIDTFRSQVAQKMLDIGVHIINDISGGTLDPNMYKIVAQYPVPYILMHIQGSPQTMQVQPTYKDVVAEVSDYFVENISKAKIAGIKDIVIDPGFGFGKTLSHNYNLFTNLSYLKGLGFPMLVGISRKSMIYKPLGTTHNDILPETAALHLKALEMGANILRVHEVKAAKRIIQLHNFLKNEGIKE